LLPWKDTTLLGHAVDEAKKTSESVVVVLGARAQDILQQIEGRAEVVINPQWEQGMGSSIAMGIRYVMGKDPHPKAVLIMVGDQPFLDAAHLRELLQLFLRGNTKVVGTKYGQSLGVPAVFDSSLFGALSRLDPHRGAKALIQKYGTEALGVDPKGRAGDIDTLEAYRRALENAP